MSNVRVILSVSQSPLDPGVSYAGTRVILTDAGGTTQTAPDFDANSVLSTLFTGVADGAFTGTVNEIDTSGNVIGTALTFSGTAPISAGGSTFPDASGVSFAAA